MTEIVGRSLGRYRIVELLGAGGMGEVYRATDDTLRRDVAIKVLSEAITANPTALDRFEREARSLAQLSHPNILAIHDFCSDDGLTYAVEELLDGRDLRRTLTRGPMPQDKVVEVICAVAEGLGAAHRKGILHRDIKPENIFVSKDGGVKILDFGLARSFTGINPDGSTMTERSALTTPGAVVGTTSYMSPEQTRGEDLTPHSDVFSLGVVFYELLTGEHPFREETAAETLASILRKHPPPPSALVPSIPPALDAVVGRCLEKSPDERFESARDIAFALKAMSGRYASVSSTFEMVPLQSRSPRRWFAAAGVTLAALAAAAFGYQAWLPDPLPEVKQIAVARFEAEGDNPTLRYLAAGLSEVVAGGLGPVVGEAPEIAWMDPYRFRERRSTDQLGAGYRDYHITLGVAGRLERKGDDLHLILDLIDLAEQSVLRRVDIVDRFENPYALQVDPVLRLAEAMNLEVAEETVEELRDRSTGVPPALEPYLEGLGRLALSDDADQAKVAYESLESAISSDSFFVAAEVAMARASLKVFRQTDDQTWLERGLEISDRVLAEQRPPVDAFLVAASLAQQIGDSEREITVLRTATEADPDHGGTRRRLAAALTREGRLSEAEEQYQRAVYIEPGYWLNNYYLGDLYSTQGRYEAAVIQARRVVELAPLFVGGYSNLGVLYLYMGRDDLARETFERSLEVDSVDNYAAFANLGYLYDRDRRYADAATMYEKALVVDDSDYRVWGNLGWSLNFSRGPAAADSSFRKALELAALERDAYPDDLHIPCDMAGYHAALEEWDAGILELEKVVAKDPTDPVLTQTVAWTFEDLGDRALALEWVERSFKIGVSPDVFENNPTLRDLVADPLYLKLVQDAEAAPSTASRE